jgi:hypothetical protein
MPAMYEVSDGRPRGTTSNQTARDLPILFHLADVSRPRAKPEVPPTNLLSEIAAEPSHSQPVIEPEPTLPPVATPALSLPPVFIPEPTPLSIEPTVQSEATPTIEASTAPTADSPTVETSTALSATSETVVPETTETETPPPAESHAVNLRKQRRKPASEDWFTSHGKYIALAFVVALIATVYLARENRERNSVAKLEPVSQPLTIELPGATAPTEQQILFPPSTSTASTTSANAVGGTPQTPPATESKVDLLAPQLVAESSSDKKKDNLFEFAAASKSSDDRVATRTDEPAKPTGQSSNTMVQNSFVPVTYPVTTPSTASYPVTSPAPPAYPTTTASTVPVNAPVAPPPLPSAYPSSAYQPAQTATFDNRSQYPAATQPATTQNQYWTPSGAAPSPSYPSYDNTARGPRNERTGSGTY